MSAGNIRLSSNDLKISPPLARISSVANYDNQINGATCSSGDHEQIKTFDPFAAAAAGINDSSNQYNNLSRISSLLGLPCNITEGDIAISHPQAIRWANF